MANIFQTTVRSEDLAAGTSEYGFGGEVSASQLWTSEALASLLGVTEGTAINSSEPYLKWFVDGRVILKSKRPIRTAISWSHLNEKNVVYGNTTIEDKYGNQYKVRLMKGALTDPYQNDAFDQGAKGSEWNRLMLPIHEQAKNKNWANPQFVEPEIPSDWNINYTDIDLSHNGSRSKWVWCQERYQDRAKTRGSNGNISYSNSYYSTSADLDLVWSPVLELIKLAPKLLLRHTKTGKIYTIKEGSFS